MNRKAKYGLIVLSVLLLISVWAGGALLAQGNADAGVQPMQPMPTCTPPCEPVPTPTSDSVWVYGVVRNEATGQGLPGAAVRLYRSAGADWTLIRETVTGPDGLFGFGISPAMSGYRFVETDPLNFSSVSATLAPGVTGSVIDANTLDFSLPASASVGPFVFVDKRDTQPGPTATQTPQPQGTPTTPSKWVYGKVIDTSTGLGLAGATVRLYRSAGAGWELLREHTTLADGIFTFGISPAETGYRLVEQDPVDYVSVEAYLPTTVSGTVVDWNTIDFTLPASEGVGEFLFVDISEDCIVVPTATATPSPTATRHPWEFCYDSLPETVLIYRIAAGDFRGYDTDDASQSPLNPVTSPPAPAGWNQPGFVPDADWQSGVEVWWDEWSVARWMPFEGATIVGLADSEGMQEGLDGITHLIRRTFQLDPPQPGMRISSAILQMWSDNKTNWWWDGVLLAESREGNDRVDEIFPVYINPEGGTYVLAIQNSNDYQYIENQQGTAFRLCITWSPAESPTVTPTLTEMATPTLTVTATPTLTEMVTPTLTVTATPTLTATVTPERVLLPLIMLGTL